MVFIILTFFAALLIEGLGTTVSVIGLSTMFGANLIIIALAIALDLGKIVTVSMLYKHWKAMGKMMRSYALIASIVTMVITSAGAAGYLSGEFQKAIQGTQENGLKVDVLKQEQAKLETRKKQIDDSIAAIPDRYTATQKIKLMAQYKEEQKQVNARLNDLSQQLPQLQVSQIGMEAKAGPILEIAKAFNITVDQAVKYVILLIIVVFDPLAIFLIIGGNFLLERHALEQRAALERMVDGPADDDEPKRRGPNPQMDELLRKASGHDAFKIENIAKATDDAIKKHEVEETLLGPQLYIPDPEEDERHRQREEAQRLERERHTEAQRLQEEELASLRERFANMPDFDESALNVNHDAAPASLHQSGFANGFDEHVKHVEQVVQATPEVHVPAVEEPITEPEPIDLLSPVVAEEVPGRPQIRLSDLLPARSSLEDARDDAAVHFDPNPSPSKHSSLYGKL